MRMHTDHMNVFADWRANAQVANPVVVRPVKGFVSPVLAASITRQVGNKTEPGGLIQGGP